jgi:hypothetical protein
LGIKNTRRHSLVGSLINLQVAILSRSRKKAFFERDKRKRDYFWTALYFNGLCISHTQSRHKKDLLIMRSHKDDLNGITGYFFTSAPNILNTNVDKLVTFPVYGGRHKLFIKSHRVALRRLRLRFSS